MLWNVVIFSELKLSFMEAGEASEDAETPQNKFQEGCEICMTWEVLKVTKITSPLPNYTSLIMIISLCNYIECWAAGRCFPVELPTGAQRAPWMPLSQVVPHAKVRFPVTHASEVPMLL